MYIHPDRIAEAVHLCHPQSGASVEYARGVLVGITTALMAIDLSPEGAVDVILQAWRPEYRDECWPQEWKERVEPIHQLVS